jgi:hypothetical protein
MRRRAAALLAALGAALPAPARAAAPESAPVPVPPSPAASASAAAVAPASAPAPESAPAPIPVAHAVVIDPEADTGAEPEKHYVEILGEAFRARIGAALQARLASSLEAPGISLSAARVLLDVRAEDLLDLRLFLQLELNPLANAVVDRAPFLPDPQPIFPLADAYIAFNVASAAIGNLGHLRIGQFKAPFGAEPLADRVSLLVPERSWPMRALSPGRDIGIEYGADFHGYGLPLAASVGVFNGSGPNRLQDAGELLGAARVWGRVGRPGRASFTLRYGLSWMMDAARRDPLTDNVDSATAFGADLTIRWRWLTVAVEGVVASTSSAATGCAVRCGFSVEALGGYATAAVQIIPEFLELTGRYERFIPDLVAVRMGAMRPAWRVSAGLNLYYLAERFRLQYLFTYSDDGITSAGADFPGVEHFFFFTLKT